MPRRTSRTFGARSSPMWVIPTTRYRRGGAPESPPSMQTFWVASTTGTGKQVLDWDVEDGDWVIVAMNADGSAGVTTELRVGAEVDPLIWIALGVLLAGVLVGVGAAALIYVGSRRQTLSRRGCE